jgi:putative transcriptional regulator
MRPLVASLVLLMWWGIPGPEPAGVVHGQGPGDRLHRRAVKDLAAGKLLVAARELGDPNFARTVVLLADLTADGAVGFIVNRPAAVTLARVFPRFAQSPVGAQPAFLGGPVVAPVGVAALVRSRDAGAGARRILDEVSLVTTREGLEEALAAGPGANRLRVYLGYAGWGRGQLDEETARGAWRVIEGSADIVFDADPEGVWLRQIRRTEALSASLLRRGLDGPNQPEPDVR